MNYRDEEDIFEEDVVFDQAGLLSSARKRGKSAIRRVSSGRCAMLSKTLALCGAFFGLGLSITLPGPATPMPPTDLDIDNGGEEYIYRCLGFMLGAMLGGMLLDRFNRLFLVFLALLMCAILVAMVPWTSIIWLLRSDLILLGATMGFLLTGGNVLCLDLWGQNSGPFMQALHFSFSLGAFLAPLIASPLNPVVSTVSPMTEHHRYPRNINDTSPGFAEGVFVLPMQPENISAISAAPVSSVAPMNTTGHPLLSSQTALVNGTTNMSTAKTSTSQNMSSLPSSTTAIPHPTHRTPKPKPEKNSGKNLDKASKWDGIHAGKPDPKDVLPIPSTEAPPSSSSHAPENSSSITVEVSNATTANNPNTTITNNPNTTITNNPNTTITNNPNTTITNNTNTTTTSSIREIFQNEPVSSKVQDTADKINEKVSTNLSEVKEEKMRGDANVSNPRPSEKSQEISLQSASTSTTTNPSTLTTNTTITISTPGVSTPSSPEASQSDLRSSTVPSTPSTARLPDTTKSTSVASTSSSPATSSSTTNSPQAPPKSLTLTEKESTTEPPAILRTSTEAPPPPTTPATPSTKVTSSGKHVDVTSPPHPHRSKPTTYDNDTEHVYTVMDQVADHFGKEYGLSRLQLSYLLVALLLFVVSLLFLGFLCFNPRDPRSRSEDDVGGGRSNVIRPRWVRITLTTLMMLLLALSAGVQFSYGQLLVFFAMRSPLALSLSTGTALTATYWGAATSTRLACILVASALSPGALLVISVALTAAATWLLSALAAQSAAALWVGAVLVAVGTASILPSSFLWMQHHVHVSHHVAGMLVMGPAMGEMLFPPLALRIVKGVGPSGLLHLPALLSLAVIALWAAAWRLARHPCSSLCAHADPAAHTYQLASQTDEDDLLDLTMSPVTHRGSTSSAHRTSSHANGNGVHRLNT